MKAPSLILSLVIAISVACSPSKKAGDFESYKDQIKQQYYEGMDALDSGNYQLAKKIFQELTKASGYLKYSKLASLRLGDTMLAEGDYITALYLYEEFLKQYKGNKNEAYAAYRKCQCFDDQIPSDWFGVPSPWTKEIANINRARTCYWYFIKKYKKSRFNLLAAKRHAELVKYLYKHEVYIVDFYWKRKKFDAVALRIKYILKEFDVLGKSEDNYYRLIVSLVKTKHLTEARNYYKDYTASFPTGKYVGKWKSQLDD